MKIYEDIVRFSLCKEKLALLFQNKFILIDGDKEDTIQIQNKFCNIYFGCNGEKIYFLDEIDKPIIFDVKSMSLEYFPYKNISISAISGQYLIFYDMDKNSNGVFDLIKNEILFENINKEDIGYDIICERVYSTLFRTLKSYNLFDGQLLWTTDLTLYTSFIDHYGKNLKGNINKIIGICNDIIWVSTTNNMLIGTDILTGKVCYEIKGLSKADRLIEFDNSIIDYEIKKIFTLYLDCLCEIECDTGEARFIDLTEEFKRHNTYPGASKQAYDGENIYFLDSLNQQGARVATFNIPSKTIIWKHLFENNPRLRLLEIQYSDDKLYVRDNYKTLHVFQKE